MRPRKAVRIEQPKAYDLTPGAETRLICAALTPFDRAPDVCGAYRDRALKHLAYAYGYRLVRREDGDRLS